FPGCPCETLWYHRPFHKAPFPTSCALLILGSRVASWAGGRRRIRRCGRSLVLRQAVSRAFREISKVLTSKDSDQDGEALTSKKPAPAQNPKWYQARESPNKNTISAVGIWEVLPAPHAWAKRRLLAKKDQVMPRQLAEVALDALRSAGKSQDEQASGLSGLRSELSGAQVFGLLRADAQELMAAMRSSKMLDADPADGRLHEQVYSFLERSWSRIASDGLSSSSSAAVTRRVAKLFGDLLAQVPEESLRWRFEGTLAAWAEDDEEEDDAEAKRPSAAISGRQRNGPRAQSRRQPISEVLQELLDALASQPKLEEGSLIAGRRVLKLLSHTLTPNRRSSRSKRGFLEPEAIAKALAAVASSCQPDLLEASLEVFQASLGVLDVSTINSAGLWLHLAGAAPAVRLILLEAIAAADDLERGAAGACAEEAWSTCGADLAAVVSACLDFAYTEEEEEDPADRRYLPEPKRPRSRRAWNKKQQRPPGEWWGPKTSGLTSQTRKRVPLTPEELAAAPSSAAAASATSVADSVTVNAAAELGEEAKQAERQRRTAEDAASAERAGRLLQRLGSGGESSAGAMIIANLGAAEALRLAQCLGGHLGDSTATVLRPVLQAALQNPLQYGEAEVFLLAQALPDLTGAHWESLASVLQLCWAKLAPGPLVAAMREMLEDLWASPSTLREALFWQVLNHEEPAVLTSLPQDQLAGLIEAWAHPSALPLPSALCLLLFEAVERRLLNFNARQLALASRLVAAGVRQFPEMSFANVNIQIQGEEPESSSSSTSVLLSWWRRWLECEIGRGVLPHSLASSRLLGWGRCHEALREALQPDPDIPGPELGPGGTAQPALLAEVLQLVIEQLSGRVAEVPLELALDLLAAAHHAPKVEGLLVSELERRVRISLTGQEAPLPLVTAVAVANGETRVSCSQGTLLWSGLAAAITAQLTSHREVDLFCRCRPSTALWDSVMQLAEGWRGLELQLRRSASFSGGSKRS
ncbi:unnamed protein product, partial [Polarella glacialis]